MFRILSIFNYAYMQTAEVGLMTFLPRNSTTDRSQCTTTISVCNIATGCTDSGHSPSDCVTWDDQNSCCSNILNV